MNESATPSTADDDFESYLTVGASCRLSPTLSEDDLRQLEVAWNDPRAYELAMNEIVVTAGYVPKPGSDLDGHGETELSTEGVTQRHGVPNGVRVERSNTHFMKSAPETE